MSIYVTMCGSGCRVLNNNFLRLFLKKRYYKVAMCVYFLLFITGFVLWNYLHLYGLQRWRNKEGRHTYTNIESSTLSVSSITKFSTPRYKVNTTLFGGSGTSMCNGSFVGFDNRFAWLREVLVTYNKSKGKAGGEYIEQVIHQTEKEEIVYPLSGYFKLACDGLTNYIFFKSDHMNTWLKSIECVPKIDAKSSTIKVSKRWIILIERYEYANLFHAMSYVYNAFLMLLKFNLQPKDVDILLMDGHPKGAMDSVWPTLFADVTRGGNHTEQTLYQNMIWSILGYNSPIVDSAKIKAPFLEEFRSFVLSGFDLTPVRSLNCSRLTVLFIWRRDYLAHPRNPSGHIRRKIKNEDELLNAARETLPNHDVRGVQIDTLPFRKQLHLVSQTDIMIGMHGAGMAHCLFLPKHGGLIELFPKYYGPIYRHFTDMAKSRDINYLKWWNRDRKNEHTKYFTTIPVNVLRDLLKRMVSATCS